MPSHLSCGSSCAPAYSYHSKSMTTLWLLPSHTEGSASVGLGRASWSFCTLAVKTVQGTLKSLNFRFLNLFTTVKVCGTSRPSVIKEEPHCCSRGQPFLTEAPSSLIGHHHHCIPPLRGTETLTRPQPASPQTRLVSEMKQGAIPRKKEKKCYVLEAPSKPS